MFRKINLFGGPGSGKSTLAAWLFARLKAEQRSVEYVQEYIKTWAYEGRKPESFDQFLITATQLHREDIVLRNGTELVITDCPIFLGACYAKRYDVPGWELVFSMAKEADAKYPPLNIFLPQRDDYQEHGRYETRDEAEKMSKFIREHMDAYKLSYSVFGSEDQEGVLEFVTTSIRTIDKTDES